MVLEYAHQHTNIYPNKITQYQHHGAYGSLPRHQIQSIVWRNLSLASGDLIAKNTVATHSYVANSHGFFEKDIWLVVDLPLWKIWKSVGMIIPNNIYGKNNQTSSFLKFHVIW